MKKILLVAVLAAVLFAACAKPEPWREVAPLPYYEEVGTITQYKNFVRGGYALSEQDTYILTMDWEESGHVEVLLNGEEGYQKTLNIESGTPCLFDVPENGLYQIKLPLDGLAISDLTFALTADG